MECAILDRRLARVANPFGIIQQTVDSLQLIRQPWSRLPCGGLCRESLKQNSHHAKLEELHPCENGHDDGAPGPHAEHALGNELQQSLSHRCDAGLEALRHVPESQSGARWKVTQHNGRADFTQHLAGKADVFPMTSKTVFYRRHARPVAIAVAAAVLLAWTVFPFVWILLTSLKSSGDILSVPPKFVFTPTFDNYAALIMGEQRGQYSSTSPDFPRFFLNSMIISFGAVALSVAAGIPAAYALARFTFPLKNAIAFVLMSFRFVPFIAFVIPLYLIYQRLGLYNTYPGLIFAYQLITLPFTIWMLRSFFMEIPLEIQEAAKIDGCSWFGVLTRVILPLSMPGLSVTVILGFMFSWNAFNYPLMLAGRQTFPVTVGAIQFISYEQVLWDRWPRRPSSRRCRNCCSP